MSPDRLSKKRKIEEECRSFQKEWTVQDFFTDVRNEAAWLICYDGIAVFEAYTLKRRYQSKHAD